MSEPRRIALLGSHDRSNFKCGVEPLDRYLRQQASQDMRRSVSNCFVALEPDDRIVAYYTFAAANVLASDLPAEIIKKLPRYPYLPAALIGRLAVDLNFQRQRLGEALIVDAAKRARQSAPAVYALLVDAKNRDAEQFYLRLGFRALNRLGSRLFLPLATAGGIRASD
jgi:GNAT superfamily N-acetyltransferase